MIPQEADQTHIEYGFPVASPPTFFFPICKREVQMSDYNNW